MKQIPRQTTKTDSRRKNLNNPLIREEISKKNEKQKTIHKVKRKLRWPSLLNSTKHLKENTNSSQILPKREEEGALPNLFYEAIITLLTKQTKSHHKEAIDHYLL